MILWSFHTLSDVMKYRVKHSSSIMIANDRTRSNGNSLFELTRFYLKSKTVTKETILWLQLLTQSYNRVHYFTID